MAAEPCRTPEPPYTAVIFSSTRRAAVGDGYDETSDRMDQLAAEQPGYLGIEASRDTDGFGITVSYWTDAAAARAWKTVAEHRLAQQRGAAQWYHAYRVRIASVEREYGTP